MNSLSVVKRLFSYEGKTLLFRIYSVGLIICVKSVVLNWLPIYKKMHKWTISAYMIYKCLHQQKLDCEIME